MTESPIKAPRPWWTAFVCGMASYIDAAAIVSWGIALVIYQEAIGLTAAEFGLLAGLLTTGIAVGALVGGRLGDRFGRRAVFIVTVAAIAIGATVMVFAQSLPLMIVATVLVGLGSGADLPVSLATIAEAAPEAKRGKMIAFSHVLWLVGSIIPGFASAAVGGLGRLGGQILFGHIAVVAVLVLLARLTIPESTLWRAAQGDLLPATAPSQPRPGSVRNLFRAPYAAPFLGLAGFFVLVTAGGNALGQYGTYILVNVAGVPVETAALAGLLAVPGALGGAFVFMKLVGTRYRFASFTAGAVLTVVGILLPAVAGVTLTTYLIALMMFSIGGAFAGDGIMKFWTQRSFPTLLRTTAQGAIISAGRFAGAGFAFLVPAIIAIDARLFFGIVGTLALAGLTIAWVVFRDRDRHDEINVESDAIPTHPAPSSSRTDTPAHT